MAKRIRWGVIGCGGIFRNLADWTETGNIQDTSGSVITSSWFVDSPGGDFHLTASATAAIDQALTLPEVADDIDALSRPYGSAPDVGADEYGTDLPPDYPTLEHAVRYLGNGKYGVSFTVRGNDGQQA